MKAKDILDNLCPGDWDRIRAKHVFGNSTNKSLDEDIQLSASQRLGVVPQTYLMEAENQKYMLALSGTENFKHVNKGDFIISLRSFEGGFEYSDYTGCVSPAYTVLCPKIQIEYSFWKHLFKSDVFKQMIASYKVGIRDGKSIRYDDFADFVLAIPNIKVQKTISILLDRETDRIDALIESKNRFIQLLQEKRQALITHAVTKGLDSTVKMKDSGVEWLGQVPEHWEISAIKHWFTTTSGGTPDTKQQDRFYTEDGGTPWIRTTDLNNGRLDEFEISITDDAIKETACSIVPCGSVLVAMYGGAGTIGKNALLKIDACINQALCALLPNRFFDDEYTFLYVQFYKPYWMIDAESSRKDPNINQDLVKNAKIMRPSINEQHDIVEYINRKTTRIDALIDKTQRSIELLKERRSALITAAVAGKIDLREAAV